METFFFFKDKAIVYAFKSYYVVWKPPDIREKLLEETKFKSYYVVWKLI